MSITISSHVLNVEAGLPAEAMQVTLAKVDDQGARVLDSTRTNDDGRVAGWAIDWEQDMRLRVTFATGDWYTAQDQAPFYPEVVVDFCPSAPGHFHIPLLISRHGYSTYRGS